MINAEKYKDELKSLNDADKLWCSAFDKRNMTFDSCLNVKCENCSFNGGKDCNNGRYNWLLSEYKKPVKLTRLEYELLKYWGKKYNYIAVDKDGALYTYRYKPSKNEDVWSIEYEYARRQKGFDDLFHFISWADKEPMNIEELLNNCEVIEND